MASSKAIIDYRAEGAAVIERLMAWPSLDKSLKKPLAEFKTVHTSLEKASQVVEKKLLARDEAIATLGSADDALDLSNETLAQKVAGAGLGPRKSPLSAFGGPSVSELNRQPYATEVKTVKRVCDKILKSAPPSEVKKAAEACQKQALAVDAALQKQSAPQAEYVKALGDRDKLLPDWDRAMRRLKRQAAAVFVDDEPSFQAIFAAPERVLRPVARRKKATKPQTPAPQ